MVVLVPWSRSNLSGSSSSIAIALEQGSLVCGQHPIHLLATSHCVLKILFHLVNMLFELLKEVEHLVCLGVET